MTHRWTADKANAWCDDLPWLVGCNFTPSTAINQIEMLAADTFDPVTIDRELGWAAGIGMNTVRVYLHDVLWKADAKGYKARIDALLAICAEHQMHALVVIFDDCWYEPITGAQLAPVPGLHNSGWARSPGAAILADTAQWAVLEDYVSDIVRHFGQDRRIIGWDIYNEVCNVFMPAMSLPAGEKGAALAALAADETARNASLALMEAAFGWVRAQNPAQPLTVGGWIENPINERLYELSDVISFHNYESAENVTAQIEQLKAHGRPLWCTEYLNRTQDCMFETHLPVFRRDRIGAWNWGLVDGKTQTKYSWADRGNDAEPEPWFHDIFHADGRPYRPSETDFIKCTLKT